MRNIELNFQRLSGLEYSIEVETYHEDCRKDFIFENLKRGVK